MSDFLALEKQNNFVNGLEMIEYLPKQRIQALIISGLLLVDWDEKFSTQLDNNKVREQYSNEVQQVKAYLKAYNPALGGIKIKYTRGRSHFGRSYCAFNYGFTPFRKITRNSLIIDLYYDFDLKNAHPSITQSICKRVNIPCPETTKYINERETIIQETCEKYNVDEDEAKDLYIRLGFGGTFEKWAADNKIISPVPTHFITAYKREVREIAVTLKGLNPTLWTNVKNNNKKGEEECLRSFFAKYLQEWETRIVGNVLSHLVNSTELMKHPTNPNTNVPVGSYEYDGFKLLKENVDKNGGIENVLQIIHQRTAEFGFPDLVWVCKPFKEFNDLTEWVALVQDTEKEDEEFKKVCDIIKRTYNREDAGAVEFVCDLYPNHFVYSLGKGDKSNQGNWYCWDGLRWRSNDLPLRNAITYDIEKKMEEMLLPFSHYKFEPIDKDDIPNANQKLHQEITEVFELMIKRICSAGRVNNIVEMARQKLVNYTLEFDIKPYLLGFENGVLDIETSTFRPYTYDDKVSFSCGYDFIPYNSKIKVFEINGKPFVRNFKDEYDAIALERVNNFFVEIFADPLERKAIRITQSSGMVGVAIQLFNIYNGSGRNGKGILNDFTAGSLGDYAVKISASVLTELRKNSAGSNPEIAKIDKKRFVYWREPPKDTPLQNSVCKDLTGGGTYEARMNYSNKTVVNLMLTMVGECNVNPPFAETPENAESERVRDYLFANRFTDDLSDIDNINVFKKDNELGNTFKQNEYKNALINSLFDDILDLHLNKYNINYFIPESIKLRSLNYLNKSNEVNNLFLEAFEMRCEERKDEYLNAKGEPFDKDWSLPSIAMIIRSSRTSYSSLSAKKKETLTKDKIIEFFNTNKIYKKMVKYNSDSKQYKLQNWRLKKVEVEDEECY